MSKHNYRQGLRCRTGSAINPMLTLFLVSRGSLDFVLYET